MDTRVKNMIRNNMLLRRDVYPNNPPDILDRYAFPGGYVILYAMRDGGWVCNTCATRDLRNVESLSVEDALTEDVICDECSTVLQKGM